MSSRRIHVVFPKGLARQPIIYEIGRNFNIVTNIHRANLEIESGWVDLELVGTEEEIDKALEDLADKGIQIDTTEEDTDQK